MWLSHAAIRRPVFTTVAVILVLVMGAVSLSDLQMDLLPEIQPPVGAVIATYPGAGPDDVLDRVTKPLEKELGTLPGLKTIQSQTQEGLVLILLEFDWSQDIHQVQNDVISRINQTRLPSDTETPSFFKFDPSAFPIMQLSVMHDGKDPETLRKDVDDIVQSLTKVPGVASADESGLLDREIRIELDADRMKRYGITQRDVKERVQAHNVSQPGGIVKDDDRDLTARVMSKVNGVKELRELTLTVDPVTRKKVTLDDVADVRTVQEERTVITRTNQKTSVGINVFKQSGANTAAVSADVQKEIQRLNKDLDTRILTIFDQGKYVERSVRNVSTTMITGAFLAMLVLFLFLRSFRSPLIVGLAIPCSVITTFVLMYFADFSLNIMTLGGLALGVGMLVDNAIVVMENIFRHLQMGKGPKEAAAMGAGEVAGAITSSTLTTVSVFVPVVFISGIVGTLFREFAFTVSFSLLASLLISLTIVPVLAAALMKRPRTSWNREMKENRLYRSYAAALKWALSHRKTVILAAVILLAAGLAGIRTVGTEYLPAADEGVFIAEVKMPPGTGLEKTSRVAREVEDIFKKEKDIESFQVLIGNAQGESAFYGESGRHIARFYVNTVDRDERSRTTHEVMNDLRSRLNRVDPDAEVLLQEQSSFEAAGTPNTLEFTVSGERDQLKKWNGKLITAIKDLDGVTEVTDSEKETQPELNVSVDRERAEKHGLAPAQIVSAVSEATRGETITQVDGKNGRRWDVVLRYEASFRNSPDKLKKLPIPVGDGSGETVPLSEVADVKVKEGPITITRSDLRDTIEYKVQYRGVDLGTVEREVKQRIREIGFPASLDVRFTGAAELFGDAVSDLTLAAALSVLFVFLVLAGQFESFKYPLVILLTLPLMVIGVSLALYLTRTPVGVTAMIGLIVLAGIVVNNAIVMVDTIHRFKQSGMPSMEAIREASTTRLRPILMTAWTTILGLIPLSLGWGEGTEIQQPMGIAVIGGLISSTLLTLFVIPVVYSWFDPKARQG